MVKRERGPDRVQRALTELRIEARVRELPRSTGTAREAALAIGCRVGQIAKSLLFRLASRGTGCLVIASGSNFVDETKLAALVGDSVEFADADFVRRTTGYVIGGVPPLKLAGEIPVYIDADLMQYAELWAAAGSPFAVVRLTPEQLLLASGGEVAEVRQEGD